MKNLLILLTPLLIVFAGPAYADDSTISLLDDLGIETHETFNDGTCQSTSNHPNYKNLCCHSGRRYSCGFLYGQFHRGKCILNIMDKKWSNCRFIPLEDQAARATQPMRGTYPTTRGANALPYAATLTSCAGYGKRQAYRTARRAGASSGSGYCAAGVRHALMCMYKKLGQPKNVHCGPGARNYYGEQCLEKLGFVNDPNSCNRPGVVRVYYGNRHNTAKRASDNGDYWGHIEFLGTDRMYHAGASNSLPIDQIFSPGRRRLKACYVLPKGRY